MAECNVQDLLDDASCFAALPPAILQVLQAQLLCNIATDGVLSAATIGTGSPEGVVTAGPGRLYWKSDAPKSLWIKETGTGNTGWVEI